MPCTSFKLSHAQQPVVRVKDGLELGEFATAVTNWSAGDEFLMVDGRRFRIVGIVPVPGGVGVFNAFWKVERA